MIYLENSGTARKVYARYTNGGLFSPIAAIVMAIVVFVGAAFLTSTRVISLTGLEFPAGTVNTWLNTGNIRAGGKMLEIHKFELAKFGTVSKMLWLTDPGTDYAYVSCYGGNTKYEYQIYAELPSVQCGNYFLAVSGDKVQVSNYAGKIKEFTYNWKQSVSENGLYDYDCIYQMLLGQETSPLAVKDAACILGLIQEGVLLGYHDREAVFARDDGESFSVILMTPDVTKEINEFLPEKRNNMMAAGHFLIYKDGQGNPYMMNLNDSAPKGYPVKFTDEPDYVKEPTLSFNYVYMSDKNKFKFTYVTENNFFTFYFEDGGYSNFQSIEQTWSSEPVGCYVSDHRYCVLMLDDGYHSFSVGEQK